MTLADLLFEHPFSDGDDLIHTVDRSVTAGEVRAAARRTAAEIGRLDGRSVAVQLPNGPEVVSTMMGVWLAGGVYVPVNSRLPAAEVESIIERTAPAAFVTPDGTATSFGRQGVRRRTSHS